MVDVAKVITELKEKVIENDYDPLYLRFTMDHPMYGRQYFLLNFPAYSKDLERVDMCTGEIMLICEMKRSKSLDGTEDIDALSEIYGEWYKDIAEYKESEDDFYEIPVETAIKVLEKFPFSSYDII